MNIRSIRFLLLSLGLLAFSAGAAAQDLETGYFLGGNPYAFRQNPAFQSERGIVSIGLGQTGLGAWSNLGVSTLLYPDNGKVYTFLNDRVPASGFLKKLHRRNSIDADSNVNLLTVGFWTKDDTFFTIDVNLRNSEAVSVPYDLFRFLKEGSSSSSSFDLSGLGFRSQTFAEAAFGWSRKYERFSVGARGKILLAGLGMEARMKKLQMSMNGERWEVTADGELSGSSPLLRLGKDENGNFDFNKFDIAEDSGFGLAGFGGAVDLGFSWDALPLLTVSGALLDFGAIRWNQEIYGRTVEGSFTWDPSGNEPIDPSSDSGIDQELEEAANSLAGLFRFKDSGHGKPSLKMFPFRLNLGAEYRMPFYERLSVGALYTGRAGNCYARHAARLSLNWNPLDFLSMSMGSTLNKLGQSIGFALNLHPVGINLMVGGDYIPFRSVDISPLVRDLPAQYSRFAVIPQGRLTMNLYVGLNVAFGRRHLDHARRLLR